MKGTLEISAFQRASISIIVIIVAFIVRVEIYVDIRRKVGRIS